MDKTTKFIVDAVSTKNCGIKSIGGFWYNFDEKSSKHDKEAMQGILTKINKGDEITLELSAEKAYVDVMSEETTPKRDASVSPASRGDLIIRQSCIKASARVNVGKSDAEVISSARNYENYVHNG